MGFFLGVFPNYKPMGFYFGRLQNGEIWYRCKQLRQIFRLPLETHLSLFHHEDRWQGGHGTGKTGKLAINFSRQGKHRENLDNTGNFPNFPKN